MLYPQVVTKGHSYSKNSTSRIWEAVASLCEWRGNYQVEIVRPPRDTCDKNRHLNVNSPVTHSGNTLIRVLAGINEQTGDISILIGKGRRFSLRQDTWRFIYKMVMSLSEYRWWRNFWDKTGIQNVNIRSSNQTTKFFDIFNIFQHWGKWIIIDKWWNEYLNFLNFGISF